jgi:hypothetical protein
MKRLQVWHENAVGPRCASFSHPDCHCRSRNCTRSTVIPYARVRLGYAGSRTDGQASDLSPLCLRPITAGGELHPAPKVSIVERIVTLDMKKSKDISPCPAAGLLSLFWNRDWESVFACIDRQREKGSGEFEYNHVDSSYCHYSDCRRVLRI